MNRLNFKDRRGNEFTFLQYNTGDVKVTKKSRLSDGTRIIDFSAEAVERFIQFVSEGEEE